MKTDRAIKTRYVFRTGVGSLKRYELETGACSDFAKTCKSSFVAFELVHAAKRKEMRRKIATATNPTTTSVDESL
jgi:hypothetical protein